MASETLLKSLLAVSRTPPASSREEGTGMAEEEAARPDEAAERGEREGSFEASLWLSRGLPPSKKCLAMAARTSESRATSSRLELAPSSAPGIASATFGTTDPRKSAGVSSGWHWKARAFSRQAQISAWVFLEDARISQSRGSEVTCSPCDSSR